MGWLVLIPLNFLKQLFTRWFIMSHAIDMIINGIDKATKKQGAGKANWGSMEEEIQLGLNQAQGTKNTPTQAGPLRK
jgi:hypothetical protein